MEDNILDLMKGLRKIFYVFISSVALAFLALIINWIYQPKHYLLLLADLRNEQSLVKKLRDADANDPLSEYLRGQFSKETGKMINNYDESQPPSDLLKREIVYELNRLIKSKTFWDSKRFQDVPLTKQTRELAEDGAQKQKEIISLNRLLLEEYYPSEITPSGDVRKPIKFFTIEVYKEYFSLVYGLLFGIFIFILFLRMRFLKITVDQMQEEVNCDPYIFFPWLASPFHKLTTGFILFWIPITIGFTELSIVTGGHLFRDSNYLMPWLFELIGIVDGVILILILVFAVYISIDVSFIRKKLGLSPVTHEMKLLMHNLKNKISYIFRWKIFIS